jgi:RNA polymerase primary sigma factor
VKHSQLQQQVLDEQLSRMAEDHESYGQALADLADRYDAAGVDLEIRDSELWRSDHRTERTRRSHSIEDQFRSEVDRVLLQDREDESRLARRIEFARLRFDRALERANIDPNELSARSPSLPQEGLLEGVTGDGSGGGIPSEVLRRWNELHALRTELVECNLYLVLINVERYSHTRVSRMDLIQEGSSVLFRAVDGFDWKRGLLFRTYAVHWLNQAFRSYLYNFGNTVRVPVYLQKAMKHVRDAVERLGNNDQDVQAIARETDLGENVVISALGASRSTHSIDSTFGSSEGEGLSLGDTLTTDDSAGLYEANMEDVSLQEGVEMALERLSGRERLVIGLRFGLEGVKEHTLAEIADHMGVSLERIRQIQVRAISKMNTPAVRKAVDPHLL